MEITRKGDDALERVKRGASVKAVRAKGRIRRFISARSERVEWKTVQWAGGGSNAAQSFTAGKGQDTEGKKNEGRYDFRARYRQRCTRAGHDERKATQLRDAQARNSGAA